MSQNVKTVKFGFIGGNSRTSKEVEWPLRIVAKSIRMYLDNAGTAAGIFQSLLPELNELRAKEGKAELTELPMSYTKHAASLHYGMRQRFLAKLEKKDVAALALAEEFDLKFAPVAPVEEPAIAE